MHTYTFAHSCWLPFGGHSSVLLQDSKEQLMLVLRQTLRCELTHLGKD